MKKFLSSAAIILGVCQAASVLPGFDVSKFIADSSAPTKQWFNNMIHKTAPKIIKGQQALSLSPPSIQKPENVTELYDQLVESGVPEPLALELAEALVLLPDSLGQLNADTAAVLLTVLQTIPDPQLLIQPTVDALSGSLQQIPLGAISNIIVPFVQTIIDTALLIVSQITSIPISSLADLIVAGKVTVDDIVSIISPINETEGVPIPTFAPQITGPRPTVPPFPTLPPVFLQTFVPSVVFEVPQLTVDADR